jgi:hypothetical protein
LEAPKFELHQVYRALEVLFDENDFIPNFKNNLATPENFSVIL